MDALLSWVLQTAVASIGAVVGFIAIKSTAFGERFLDHHLQRKIEDLKHAHGEKIEAVRVDLAHLQDRGRRANELEFDAASKIWQAFVDAWMKTQQAIVDYSSLPDLNKLDDDGLAAFLETSGLSDQQREQVLHADDKLRMYLKIERLRKIHTAGAAIYDGRLLLRTNAVFISSTMATAFKEGFEVLSKAQVEQYVQFQHGSGVSQDSSFDLIGGGADVLHGKLETLVRETLRRE